jgi:sec-independent protein translocase protein TatC
MSDKPKEKDEQKEMTFFDHLEELRWHIIRGMIGIISITVLVLVSKNFIFDKIIFAPKSSDFYTFVWVCKLSHKLGLGDAICVPDFDLPLQNLEMAGQFLTYIKVSLIIGFIVSFPYLIYELWKFIKPGLYKTEVQATQKFVGVSSILFLIGVLFGYFIILPFATRFFFTFQVNDLNPVENRIRLMDYINFITMIVIATGIMFELPVASFVLSKLGLITPDMMRTYRKHSIVVILILSAVITPADPWSQILVAIPVFFLYEISILISARVQRQQSE